MIDILAIGAHPDDIEFACGGILAKMAHQGKKIVMADMTLGEKGTNGTPEIRKQESISASDMIGAKRVFLDFVDCEIIDTYEGRLRLVKLIREQKPKLVIAPLWKGEQNHPDHLATGKMARYACRYARFGKILPEYPVHRVEGILHYPAPTFEGIDFIVDITEHAETWKKMMRCHASQMATFDYEDWNLRLASKLGMLIGKPYAQGLVKGNPIVLEDIMVVSKGSREF
jgi:bacillithiol biosynthesis deacetylase BshB1